MTADTGARRREPFLLGIIGALLGIGLAVVVFGGFGGGGLVGASASATVVAGASTAPSATLAAVATVLPSAGLTQAPATDAPTTAPTTAPTVLPTNTPKPTPTANTSPIIVSFETPKQEDCTNSTAGSVHLKWTIRNATGVTISIDGPGIYQEYAGLTREVDLPYGCDFFVLKHTYTIKTVGGSGPAATITRTIKTRAPSITSFTVSEPDCSGGGVVGVTMTYEIRAATGAELYRGDELWATYNGKVVSAPVQFNCAQAVQQWKLVTTGGYGPAKSMTIEVRS